jgi:hypothetical protein
MSKLVYMATGASGAGAIELVKSIEMVDVTQGTNLVGVLAQVIIGIITIIKLLQKKRV